MTVEEGRSARKLLGAPGSSRVAANEPAQGAGALPGLEPRVLRRFPRNSAHGQPGAARGWLKGKTTPPEAADFPQRLNNRVLQGKEAAKSLCTARVPGDRGPRGCQGGRAWPGRGASVGSGGTGKRAVPK